MKVSNINYFYNQKFEDYLKMPGTSFSATKNELITPTESMKLGTRVHNYLNEPHEYDWADAEKVIPIATALRATIGDAFSHLKKEVGFTSNFTHNGMTLDYKGRADMLYVGKVVIDIKVLAGSIDSAIERFGYDRQISGYCLATGANFGLIISWNKMSKKVEKKMILPSDAFWKYQCAHRGFPT